MTTQRKNKLGGQGRVIRDDDLRLARNRNYIPSGQGRVTRPDEDKRLAKNRKDSNGIGRVRDPETDMRLAKNRQGPSGQGKCIRDDDKRRSKFRNLGRDVSPRTTEAKC